jgi:hypothetical protein
MSSYFDRSLRAVGLAATLAIVVVSSLACTGPAQGNKVTDGHMTAQQCIDNKTAGSVEPFEEDLVAEGLVNTELNKIPITRGMCEEIIERTPGGSPIARAAVVGNLTQEFHIIKNSMEDASGKDVNGDGMVNAKDNETADSASFAAARAAQETLRRAPEEGGTDGGGNGELDVEPAAFLQDVVQDQYDDGGGDGTASPKPTNGGGGGGGVGTASPKPTNGGGGGGVGTASPKASPKPTNGGGGNVSGTGSGGGDGGGGVEGAQEGAQMTVLPSREQARTNASRAAREEGADKKAAAAGGQCAATVGLTDTTLRLLQGRSTFDPPAKKLHWKDRDRTQLVMTPKDSDPIVHLEQELDQAEGAAKAAHCMQLGNQMEAKFIADEDLDITLLDNSKKEVPPEEPIMWRWDIVASEIGQHPLYLNVSAHVSTPKQGEGFRAAPQNPPLFDGNITVNATGWEVFTDFVARRWPVLVPSLLTIVTAIIILFVLPWWRRRHQPRELRDRSSGAT